MAAISFCGCAAVGSCSCFGCVTRSLARALRRMSASGEAIFSLASAAGCARFYKLVLAYECTGGRYAALRCVISSASQRRSCLRAVNRTHSHAWSAGLRNTISRASLVRSTAKGRPPQRKCRCVQVKPLLSRRARDGECTLSSASDGHMVETVTQDDLSGPAGTPVACRRDICRENQNGFLVQSGTTRSRH